VKCVLPELELEELRLETIFFKERNKCTNTLVGFNGESYVF
jgi:hypothetical protein